ncbi:class I SAM-dependent methyltransferase [Kitasatospora sp. NPDC093806]|uniref:class I SAM-dependent methyltransferase n=1 Tax=Kitasatospora sp. NPDC093806 TaxID=3155075 RepID=UPI003421EE88
MTATTVGIGTSAADIEFHYDLGNEFYALWLDETRTYSAAVWDGIDPAEPHTTALPRAQRAKLDLHLDLAGAPRPGTGGTASTPSTGLRLLDVGCGWGGLLAHAVRTGRAAEATGLTLSRAQHAHVRSLGLPGVDVRLEGWDRHHPERPYDGIVSVGAFEHFATADLDAAGRLAAYRAYFERCHGWLRPGARMSLQTIAYDGVAGGDGPVGSFVAAEIFPGAVLPRLGEIVLASDPYFAVTTVRASAEDYARTLAAWSARLLRARAAAEELVGPDGYHRYRRYLRACEVTFLRGAATLYRIGFRRRDEPLRLPV